MSFCTVINCMDGRVQVAVIEYLRERFGVDYVDSITEAGPNLILAKQENNIVESIFARLKISVEHHGSLGIAVAGHYDCAGNPATKEEQAVHTLDAMRCIKRRYSDLEIIGL